MLIWLLFLLATPAYSQIVVPSDEGSVPMPVRSSEPEEILIILKDGSVKRYKPSDWAVVKKADLHNARPDAKIIEKVVTIDNTKVTPNTVGILAGYGTVGLSSVLNQDGSVRVWKEKAPVVGAYYSRSIESWSAMFSWYSNDTVSIGSGYSF